jgi:hypothetical protein
MSAETVLYAALSDDAGVESLVSTRIYPDVSPQDVALPAVSFTRVGTEYINTIHGAAVGSFASLEVWCMARTRLAAEDVADAVELAARAATFVTTNRRAEYDDDAAVWASVVTVDYLS